MFATYSYGYTIDLIGLSRVGHSSQVFFHGINGAFYQRQGQNGVAARHGFALASIVRLLSGNFYFLWDFGGFGHVKRGYLTLTYGSGVAIETYGGLGPGLLFGITCVSTSN